MIEVISNVAVCQQFNRHLISNGARWGKILFLCSNNVSYHQVELKAKSEQCTSIQV